MGDLRQALRADQFSILTEGGSIVIRITDPDVTFDRLRVEDDNGDGLDFDVQDGAVQLGGDAGFAVVRDPSQDRLEFRDLENNTAAFFDRNQSGDVLSGRSDEEIEDVVNALLGADSNLSVSYNDANDNLTFSLASTIAPTTINMETVGTERHYAGSYGGNTPEARLDNAISAADLGDTIFLEKDVYSNNRTVSTTLTLIGTDSPTDAQVGTNITGDWTFNTPASVLRSDGWDGSSRASWTVSGDRCYFSEISNTDFTVDGNRNIIESGRSVNVTFNSNTSNNIADVLTNASVTDNGTNTIGTTT